jgi:hypothetical protein
MTRKQMEKFIKLRNKSGFNSNLQFMIDMREAGIEVSELENCTNLNERIGCWWDTPVGVLVELHGRLTLYPSGTIIDMSTGKPFEAAA